MDFHIITSTDSELVARMVDGQLVIVPPVLHSTPADAQAQPEHRQVAATGARAYL